ncbi:MAG TPA: PP2C family protein-serine/threonine phosphatase [Terracidiphilus sp.]|nr:PP2C family protein-serine/threonine phosphatase [Terracidiphilus sp.]
MLPHIAAVLLLDAGVPLIERLFRPVPLVQQLQQTPLLIGFVLMCCLAAAYLALWRAAPDFRAFRSLGIFYAIVGLEQFCQYFGGTALYWTLVALATAMLVEAAGEAMQAPHLGWTRLLWPIYAFAGIAGWFPSLAFVHEWPIVLSEPTLAVLIVQSLRGGNRRDRMVAAAFSAFVLVRITVSSTFQHLTGMKNYAVIGGWQWHLPSAVLTLLGAVTLTILVRDLVRDRGEKQRLGAELAAARAVQQVLIPEEIPAIPGFDIQSVYKPYGDVGGDLFQILPVRNEEGAGGVLVIIGDVSGKGMPAAMTVSLLVGTVRTLAHYTQRPGEILTAMNQRMLTRSHGGFTTCLVLRADADGTLTIANAGHIAPYVDGEELQLENGLPLGISADTIYTESTFQLSPGKQLTLLTDGVIEARDKTGALFGFERSASLSTRGVEAIAQAAQAFGQDDDITVLSVTRTVDAAPARASLDDAVAAP